MSLTDTRHISFYKSGETHLVPTHGQVERLKGKLKVRFTFEKGNPASEIDEVVVDNTDGYIRMVTSKGKEFNGGPLFDQLYVWYDYIEKR
ncbi:hypothetical protein [Mucilaginibacter psychrotolerans]|uniref:Uncharacterized protein n=1 Tax=Mucilaginibacter psychrotolerans TaxID=1524096 RepID=A0A4Y8SFF4_9SPHI|nr:hypothetical protein [Mucilaginibacter psychrotolerans]TFF37106.1 hypothetical protein E2R66_13570 [Mucilaginibacter psychrotolerans]